MTQGKVAIVTGGGSGVGRAASLALTRMGAQVVFADCDEAAGAETLRLSEAEGGAAAFARADVSDAEDVKAMVATARTRFGRLDILVNNAAICTKQMLLVDAPDEDFDRTLAVNMRGVWLGMKHAIPLMIEGSGGCIVRGRDAWRSTQ